MDYTLHFIFNTCIHKTMSSEVAHGIRVELRKEHTEKRMSLHHRTATFLCKYKLVGRLAKEFG